jgi:hypothetical protein
VSDSHHADVAAVEALLDAFGRALEARDSAGMLAAMTENDDVTIIPSEGVTAHVGRAAVTAFLARLHTHTRRYGWRWTGRRISVHGNTAWFVAVGDEVVEESGRHWTLPYCLTGTAIRAGDGWRLQLLHASEEPPDSG